jgi:hypothetical protein
VDDEVTRDDERAAVEEAHLELVATGGEAARLVDAASALEVGRERSGEGRAIDVVEGDRDAVELDAGDEVGAEIDAELEARAARGERERRRGEREEAERRGRSGLRVLQDEPPRFGQTWVIRRSGCRRSGRSSASSRAR